MSRRDLIELALLLGRETKASAAHVTKLLRLAAKYRRHAEHECNYTLGEKQQMQQRDLSRAIHALAREIGATGVILSGDPRGCTVKLTVKSGATNDFGNEGICIL
jgi:hypothetical protein